MNLSNFAERLAELLFENELSVPKFAKEIDCARSTINSYLNAQKMPVLDMVVRMSDYFQCTTDFLLGLTDENSVKQFTPLPPFSQRFPMLCKKFGYTKYRLQKLTGIPESSLYNWQRGDNTPAIDRLVQIAEIFGCSVDYLIGRSNY